ncbi:MAG: hypothetical protein Q9168_000337 [Polycauliona sp. 1 TL-2023]
MGYTEDELAQYERMSNDYVPEAETLPHQFSQYRTIKGDGNCGWRALAFGYFEALLHTADPSRVLGEVARLISHNNALDSVGYARDIYEDFTDVTLDLLKETAATLPAHDDGAALLASFNDASICNAIIMHFRLITSAWMKRHPDSYIHYTENQNIQDYCSTHIEPHAVEIDNLGLQACVDAIMKPAGIAVQVLYLDRSPGAQVNQIWPAEPSSVNASYNGLSTIRLLYRPGHYDILYKHEDIDMIPAKVITNPQIHLMSDPVYIPSSNVCYSQQGLDLDTFEIPGLFSAGVSTLAFSTDAYMPNSVYVPSTLPITTVTTEPYSVAYSEAPKAIVSPPTLEGPWNEGPFRPSHYQVEHKFRLVMPIRSEPCQTEAMKQ